MGFFDKGIGRGIAGIATGGASEAYRLIKRPGFSPSGYAGSPGEFKSYTAGMELPKEVKIPDAPDIKNPEAYKEKGFAGPLPEYDLLRRQMTERIQSDASRKKSEAQDAIKRRFASMGGLNTGSYIKQSQLADESADTQAGEALKDANLQLGFQEAQARRGLEREESQKAFQSGEAAKGREFQIPQLSFQNKFQAADFGFRQNLAQFDSRSKLKQLDLAFNQLEMDRINTQFNKELARHTADNSGGLFGAGGVLGLGIG